MSALMAILVLLAPQEDDAKRVRDTVLGLPGIQQKAPPPAPPKESQPTGSFMTPRVKRSAEDYKELLDHNVFSPPRKKEAPKPEVKPDAPKPPEGPKTRTWVVTGIVFNAVDKRYEALIEDPGKESKYLKVGDTIAGVTISEVTFDQVSVLRDKTPEVLKMKGTLTETVAAGGNGSAAPAKVEDAGDVEKARERMKKRNRREIAPDESEDEGDTKKKPK